MASDDLADYDAKTSRTDRPMEHDSRKPSLYEDDFFGWTAQQAALLRGGHFKEADLENIVEEIETLGRSEKRELESAYRLICMHLLKMIYQPDRASRSWLKTIVRERNTVENVLDASPSLKARRTELLAKAYRQARKEAAAETGLSRDVFPQHSPFSADQVEDDSFVPLAISDDASRVEDSGAAEAEQ